MYGCSQAERILRLISRLIAGNCKTQAGVVHFELNIVMLGRQVKCLLKERRPQAPISEDEEDSQSDEELPETSKPAFNPFALRMDNDEVPNDDG
jgi:hypothetical protein